jgi:hypothetical protein
MSEPDRDVWKGIPFADPWSIVEDSAEGAPAREVTVGDDRVVGAQSRTSEQDLCYADGWVDGPGVTEEPGESTFALQPENDPRRLAAQGGAAAAISTGIYPSIPDEWHWYDGVETVASFLGDWLVQENTVYAPKSEAEANDPSKRSMSDLDHALLSGAYWGAGRIAAPVVERFGPTLRGLLPKWAQSVPVEPVLAGGTSGGVGAVGEQIADDASYGELSDEDDYLARAAAGIGLGLGIGGLSGGLSRTGRPPREAAKHAVYEDGHVVTRGNRPPRLPTGPDPGAGGAHSRLRWDPASPARSGEGNGRIYQCREFDNAGAPVRDIDFTSPTQPNGRPYADHLPPPHQHGWIPNDPNNLSAGYRRNDQPAPLSETDR